MTLDMGLRGLLSIITISIASVFCPILLFATENLPRIPFAESAHLPEPEHLVVTPWYAYSVFRKVWIGDRKTSIEIKPKEDFELNDGMIRLDYGLNQRIAFDLTLGYTSAATRSWTPNNKPTTTQGLMDTQMGVRYRLLDEFQSRQWYVPTLTTRLGAIFQGSYSADFPVAPGDGATGIESSLMLTKSFRKSGFGLYGEFGYRLRNHGVPQTLFSSGGISQAMNLNWLMASLRDLRIYAGYRGLYDLNGGDFSGRGRLPGVPFDFVEVGSSRSSREIYHAGELGLSITDTAGRRYFFSCSHPFDGRNTPKSNNFIIGLEWPLGIK
jgi:hypothetical protein